MLQQASAELREPALGAVMALWDRYVALQRTTWKHAVDLRRRDTWADALAERSQGRRVAMGAEWAQAFYGEEELAKGMTEHVLERFAPRASTTSGSRAEQAGNA